MPYNPVTPSDPLSTSAGDINTAFDLCSTMFASATAPGTIQAYSNWIDTDDTSYGSDVLKIRDSENGDWVKIYQLGSQTGPVLSDSDGDSITIQSPATIGTSYTLTFPADQGGSNTFLKNNGSGVFSWSTVAGGVVDIGDLGDVTITSAAAGEYLRYSGSAWVDSALLITDLTVTSEARGDVIIRNASGWVRLGKGGAGSVLSSDGTDVSWSTSNIDFGYKTITPSTGDPVVAQSAADDLVVTGGTGVTITGSTTIVDSLTFATNDGQIDHNELLNYDADKHPDRTGTETISGTWTFSRAATGTTIFDGSGGDPHSVSISGDLIFDRGSNDSTITTDTLTAVRTWTLPDATGTVTVLGNSTTGSTNIVRSVSPTITGGTFNGILNMSAAMPIRFNGTSKYVGLVAPTGNSDDYTLTLPDASELPSDGEYYLMVNSAGTLSFVAPS